MSPVRVCVYNNMDYYESQYADVLSVYSREASLDFRSLARSSRLPLTPLLSKPPPHVGVPFGFIIIFY